MRYVLNLAYLVLLLVLSPWLLFAAVKQGKYREGLSHKLLGQVPRLSNHGRRVWFHAVSVGEINLLDQVLSEIGGGQGSDVQIVISTTTKTGYDLARRKHPDRTVFYCPLDFSWAVSASFRRLQPELLVLVELELWPNMLMEARRRGVPVVVINGRLSDQSARGYGRIRWFIRHWLQAIHAVAAQSDRCARRFISLGVPPDRVRCVGSLKFDGASVERENPETAKLRLLAGIRQNDVVFLAGSTQAPEEQYAVDAFTQLVTEFPTLRLILAPRHPQRVEEIVELLEASGQAWVRRSELHAPLTQPAIVLVDTVGELGAWWGCADIGFVGGSMGTRGGQNMLEPAGMAVATCFGPKTANFRDVVAILLDAEAAEVVAGKEELAAFVRKCLESPSFRTDLGQCARRVVLDHRGALAKTVLWLREFLDATPSVAFSPRPDTGSVAVRGAGASDDPRTSRKRPA